MTAMRNEPRSEGYRRPALSLLDRVTVLELYALGWSLRELARLFGCTTAPIVAVLDEHGVARRPTNNPAGRSQRRKAAQDDGRVSDYWNERRRRQGKPDLSRCAAELRIALRAKGDR